MTAKTETGFIWMPGNAGLRRCFLGGTDEHDEGCDLFDGLRPASMPPREGPCKPYRIWLTDEEPVGEDGDIWLPGRLP